MSAKIILLCEDKQTDCFVRKFLAHRNWGHRDILTLPVPGGAQSGEQWVRTRYPKELTYIRRKQRAVLLVVIDADTNTTRYRRTQLEQECREQGVPPNSPSDPVILVVPRRNIETWFYFLQHKTPVDETMRYPKLGRESDCRQLADELHRICHERQRLPAYTPESLKEACLEYPKLTQFLR